MATIFSMVLSASVMAVLCNFDRPLLAVATPITAIPPSNPTASTTMAMVNSSRLNPREFPRFPVFRIGLRLCIKDIVL
jgi:hypothetical protein